jgi:hypothetical protein
MKYKLNKYPEMLEEFKWMEQCYPYLPVVEPVSLYSHSEPLWFNAKIYDLTTGEVWFEKRCFNFAYEARDYLISKMREFYDHSNNTTKTHLL